MSKPKQTDGRIDALMNALRAGNTRSAASTFAGINRATFYRWMEDDATLRDSVEKAEADAEVRYASQVARAATDGTWQAAAWWLERRRHADYGRRDRVDMTMDVRREAERIAADLGLDADAVMAEAEAVLRGA